MSSVQIIAPEDWWTSLYVHRAHADISCFLQLAHNIQALASKGDLTFAAVGAKIVVCKRAHRYCSALVRSFTMNLPLMQTSAEGCRLLMHESLLVQMSMSCAFMKALLDIALPPCPSRAGTASSQTLLAHSISTLVMDTGMGVTEVTQTPFCSCSFLETTCSAWAVIGSSSAGRLGLTQSRR